MARAYNFSPGPAVLPEAVLRQAQGELLEYRGCAASVLEISHRGAEFMELAQRAETDLRTLLSVPDDSVVLFASGGATTVQALLPLNFAAPGQTADYVISGHWGKTALRQAVPVVDARCAASSEGGGFRDLPERSDWDLSPDAAYVHLTANETIHGVEWRTLPQFGTAPVVADFSSSIASEPIDVARFGVIYAGAQKNLGPAGITVLIVRADLLEREGQPRAPILDYRAQAKAGSMLNTPPTWNWYLLGLCLRWMLDEGGVDEFAQRNARKAALLYAAIDGSGGYYRNEVAPRARSRMNVPFFLHDPALDAAFLAQAREAGLIGLKGHRVLGGMRVSLYNAMPLQGVQALVDFMQEFSKAHG